MKNEDILELSNNLTNENLRFLLDVMAERITVHCGTIDNRCVGDDILCCTLNGSKVQINLMHSEKDLKENDSWHWALYGDRNDD